MIEINFFNRSREQIAADSTRQLQRTTEPWQQEVFQFLGEWYSDAPVIEAHTSGSTGAPKRVLLEKDRMRASARMTGEFLQMKPGDRALLCLPIRYIAGKMMLVRAATLQLRLYVVKPSSTPLTLVGSSIDLCAMVPNQVFASIEELEKVHILLIGGGPVNYELESKLKRKGGSIFHTYGMTETLTHVAMRRINEPGASRYFKALPGVSFRVDERDCLAIDAPHLIENELITNDCVELSDSKSFVWKGRMDHVIISGGIKIQPEEVERALEPILDHRYFVAGIPDPSLGQKLILVVEGDQRMLGNISQLLSKISLAPYQFPREVYFLPQFEETPTGKVQRTKTVGKLFEK